MPWQRPRDRFQAPETVSRRTDGGKVPVRGPCHTTEQGLPNRWAPERFPLDSEAVSEEVPQQLGCWAHLEREFRVTV